MTPSSDPLADLRGLHLPPDPGFWPLAPGWWVLLVAVLVLGALAAWLWRRRVQRPGPNPALAEATRLPMRAMSLDDAALIAHCAALLRRVAVQQHGPQVAGLAGTAWAQHLAAHAPDADSASDTHPHWQLLADSRYTAAPVVPSRSRLIEACQAWVSHVVNTEARSAHV